jgi:hypothetical protein
MRASKKAQHRGLGALPSHVLDALRTVIEGEATPPVWKSEGATVFADDQVIAVFSGPNAEANADFCASMRAGSVLMLEEIRRLRSS